jgi:hypothetical protein
MRVRDRGDVLATLRVICATLALGIGAILADVAAHSLMVP